MMDRKELVGFLNSLQEKFPVSNWKYDGIDVWPILKIKLFFLYLNKYIETPTSSVPSTISNSKKHPILKFIESRKYYNFLKKKKNTDSYNILFSSSKPHYSFYKNEYVNRFFYPFEEYIQKKHLQDKVTVGHWSIGYDLPSEFKHAESSRFIEKAAYSIFLLKKLKSKFFKEKTILELPEFNAFFDFISLHFSSFFKNAEALRVSIVQMIQEIKTYKELYKKLIPSSVKVAVEVCYYYTQHLGLNAACKELNIHTVEIMHGGMGDLHIAYSGWEYGIPKMGYTILPEYMWLWDAPSLQLVNNWMQGQDYHKAFLGGNSWLNLMVQSEDFIFPKDKKIIIVTMQWHDIDPFIYEAIEQTSEDYEWWIRCHPARPKAKETLKENLVTKSLEQKVNLEEANTYPLPIILKNAHVHISAFSGSIIEAAILNVPSIIISSIGAQAYNTYVKAGMCFVHLSENSKELVQTIHRIEHLHRKSDNVDSEFAFEKVIGLID